MRKLLAIATVLAAMVLLVFSSGANALTDGSWHVETVDSDGDLGEYTSIALDSSDNLHISYHEWQPDRHLKYAYYDGSWHKETLDDAGVGEYTSIALDSGDQPHISYLDRAN